MVFQDGLKRVLRAILSYLGCCFEGVQMAVCLGLGDFKRGFKRCQRLSWNEAIGS